MEKAWQRLCDVGGSIESAAAGFVERKGKSLIPTKAGIYLVTVLRELLTSPHISLYSGMGQVERTYNVVTGKQQTKIPK